MRAAVLILILATSLPAAASDDKVTTAGDEQSAASAHGPGSPAQRPAGPTSTDRKRRGSVVGYIADATLDSQVRVRFDAGFHNNHPDRAEFFYAQCGCNGGTAPGPKGLATDLNFQQVTIDAQYAVRDRVALLAAIPLRFIQPQTFFRPDLAGSFGNQAGIGDIRVGVKAAVVSDDDTVLSAQVQGYFQTGDSTKGLGTDHTSVETALLFYRKLSDRLALESQLSDWHPIGGSTFKSSSYAGDVLSYGIGPSFELVNTNRVRLAPVIELVGWHAFGGLQVIPGGVVVPSDANIVNLKFGARTTIDGKSSFYVGYGRALTDAVWYSDIVRFEYRFSF
jgi:hypothetical protein